MSTIFEIGPFLEGKKLDCSMSHLSEDILYLAKLGQSVRSSSGTYLLPVCLNKSKHRTLGVISI